MNKKPKVEVCLSPALLHLYDTSNSIVVIIDIFRATSTITAALHNGAASVIPVASVSECIEIGLKTPNSLTAGERDGKIAEGLAYGNSPLEYPKDFINGKNLVLTTTNGTKLLHMVKNADSIIIGSFLNLTSITEFIIKSNKNVLLACAAWKDKFNLEDTLFAGAVVKFIQNHYLVECDSARASRTLFQQAENNLLGFLEDSSHFTRLSGYGLLKDLEYCTTLDLHPIVPILVGDILLIKN